MVEQETHTVALVETLSLVFLEQDTLEEHAEQLMETLPVEVLAVVVSRQCW